MVSKPAVPTMRMPTRAASAGVRGESSTRPMPIGSIASPASSVE